MKITVVWLLFGVFALMVPFAETFSCYDCVIDNTDGNGTTCPEPLTPSETQTCEGEACLIIWMDYGSRGNKVKLTCLPSTGGYKLSQCLKLNEDFPNYHFYFDKDMCCTKIPETRNDTGSMIQYDRTICGCEGDYCNGNATGDMPAANIKMSTPTMDMSTVTMDMSTASTSTITAISDTNTASFGNWRRSDGYMYGFVLIVAKLINTLLLCPHFSAFSSPHS